MKEVSSCNTLRSWGVIFFTHIIDIYIWKLKRMDDYYELNKFLNLIIYPDYSLNLIMLISYS